MGEIVDCLGGEKDHGVDKDHPFYDLIVALDDQKPGETIILHEVDISIRKKSSEGINNDDVIEATYRVKKETEKVSKK